MKSIDRNIETLLICKVHLLSTDNFIATKPFHMKVSLRQKFVLINK